MSLHFRSALDKLQQKTFALIARVEENLSHAVRSVHERNEQLARTVIRQDDEIDTGEVAVEEECLKILALHQPVAKDLRYVVSILKLNSDLERIGDLAVNIAERAICLERQPEVPILFDFDAMGLQVIDMVKRSVDSLIRQDVTLANEVCASDDDVDAMNRRMYDQVKGGIREHPAHIDGLIHLLSVSRYLERAADHATNIAEDVIYLVEGRIMRHVPDLPERMQDGNAES